MQTSPDGGGIPTDGSNSTTTRGLAIDWVTRPAQIPGEVDGNISVNAMTFRLANVRVIGDAGPGDTRTSKDMVDLAWKTGVAPEPVTFEDAPIGLYSRVILLASGTVEYAYEISGTAKVNGNTKPFTIHDLSPLAVTMNTSAMLDPNSTTTLAVTIRIDQALQSLDFSKLTDNSGTLTLDTFDDEMSDFREKLMNDCFEADHGGGSN
ncbi:MAG TPA: hypothetical protein VGC41_00725 [Kofleriaceae bacterium]